MLILPALYSHIFRLLVYCLYPAGGMKVANGSRQNRLSQQSIADPQDWA
jgi:hypothetical protein